MVKILRCFDSILITKEDIQFLLIWLITPAAAGISFFIGGIYPSMPMIIIGMILAGIFVAYFIGALMYQFFSRWWDNMGTEITEVPK